MRVGHVKQRRLHEFLHSTESAIKLQIQKEQYDISMMTKIEKHKKRKRKVFFWYVRKRIFHPKNKSRRKLPQHFFSPFSIEFNGSYLLRDFLLNIGRKKIA